MRQRSKRFRWARRVSLVVLILLVACAVGIRILYPFSYVFRVFAYRGPDFIDIHRFPSREIAASGSPSELPVAIDPQVAAIVELHPDIDDFDAFLSETDTTAFLVAHEGVLVGERYGVGHGAESFQNTFSVSKSVMSALVGLAIRDGVLEPDDSIVEHLPELGERDERFAAITIRHLLDMRSGIRYSSGISFPIVNSDNPLIYYHPDLQTVVLNHTQIESPPGTFEYNNYNPPLVGLILRRTTGLPVSEYLERELWQPLGAARSAGWTVDDHGFERMESGFHACARDLARFGLLYLKGGRAAGQQVLPNDWVMETTRLPEPIELEKYNGRAWVYKAGWWIVPRPDGPADFCAVGHFGQFIYASPQHEVVFVRNGTDRGDWGDYDWTELFYFVAERL